MKNKKQKIKFTVLFMALVMAIQTCFISLDIRAEDTLDKTIESTKQKDGAYTYTNDNMLLDVSFQKHVQTLEDAILSLIDVTVNANMKQVIESNAKKQKQQVKTIQAYDMVFTKDATKVTSDEIAEVNIRFTQKKADVQTLIYIYNKESNVTTLANTVVAADGSVQLQMQTNATLLLVDVVSSMYPITIEHFNEPYTTTNNTLVKSASIFANDVLTLEKGSAIASYIKKSEWQYSRVVIITKDAQGNTLETPLKDIQKIAVTESSVYRIYYSSAPQKPAGKPQETPTIPEVATKPVVKPQTKVLPKEKAFEVGKSAHVADWEKRIYDIELSASAIPSQTTTSVPTDVILVLDRSSSMTEDFEKFILYGETEFKPDMMFFHKTPSGVYQRLNVDTTKSKTTATYIDTENNDKVVTFTLGKDPIYIRDYSDFALANEKVFDIEYTGDDFMGNPTYISENSYFYRPKYDEIYYIDEFASPTKAEYGVFENGAASPTKYKIELDENFDYSTLYKQIGGGTKLNSLNAVAKDFIDNVISLSPESRIGLIDFSTKSTSMTKIQEVNGKTMFSAQSKSSIDRLKEIIDAPNTGANTRTDLAYGLVEKLLGDKSKWEQVDASENRQTMVVFFTDGVTTNDSGSYSEGNALKAAKSAIEIKNKYDATIYALGVFDAANEYGSLQSRKDTKVSINQVNLDMRAIASPGGYMTAENTDTLNNKFTEITNNMASAIGGAKITDVIDKRFELTADAKKELLEDGATITENTDGTTTVTWNDEIIKVKGENTPGWVRTFKIQAKADYIGENNVLTNGEQSYVTAAGKTLYFPKPVVNVRAKLDILNEIEVLFLGESIPTKKQMTEKLFEIININASVYKVPRENFTFEWLDENGNKVLTDWSKIKPSKDVKYFLNITYSAGKPSAESNANTTLNNKPYFSGDAINNIVSVKATYDVKVVKGQLHITKSINEQYTSIKPIRANQTFVFKIERFAVDADNKKVGTEPVDVFYETISFAANATDVVKTKTISGLPKGYYTVSEEVNWSSKYTLEQKNDNYSKNKVECEDLFIGERTKTSNDKKDHFYGLEQDENYLKLVDGLASSVNFTNTINTNWVYMSDTASAVNNFIN